jgi:hypothetical protein
MLFQWLISSTKAALSRLAQHLVRLPHFASLREKARLLPSGSMVKDYQVELTGDAMDLRIASSCFTHGPVRVVENGGKYRLEFPELRHLQDVDEIHNRASGILREVNAALRLLDDQQGQINVGAVSFTDDKGEHRGIVLMAASLTVRVRGHATMTVRRADGSTVDPGPSLPEKSASLASFDPIVQRVVRLWAEFQHDGAVLFKIYELVRNDMGGEGALVHAGLVTDAAQSAFTGSINRADVLGEFARHAVPKGGPPKRTFGPNECVAFIKALVSTWISKKYEVAVQQGRIK